MSNKRHAAETAAEIMIACRGEWITAAAAEERTDIVEHACLAWMRGLAERGVLLSRRQTKRAGQRGVAPLEFTVAPAWKGEQR